MTTYAIRVRPGASRTRVGGTYGDALVVAVQEPAVDGRANDAVIRALAEALGVRRSDVEIVHGHTARTKTVRISDPPPDLDDRMAALRAG